MEVELAHICPGLLCLIPSQWKSHENPADMLLVWLCVKGFAEERKKTKCRLRLFEGKMMTSLHQNVNLKIVNASEPDEHTQIPESRQRSEPVRIAPPSCLQLCNRQEAILLVFFLCGGPHKQLCRVRRPACFFHHGAALTAALQCWFGAHEASKRLQPRPRRHLCTSGLKKNNLLHAFFICVVCAPLVISTLGLAFPVGTSHS